jgi:hypothetical protein
MRCERCLDNQRAVYRVTSDVINLRVCASCAAEARRLGLAVEVFSVGESKTLRAALSETVQTSAGKIAQAVIASVKAGKIGRMNSVRSSTTFSVS